jgi:predicted nucleic acid-binding protein
LSFDVGKNLRRIKPEKIQGLVRRPEQELPFIDPSGPFEGLPLLLDTCVYIDILHGSAPSFLQDLLNARHCHHSSVCLAELVHPLGRLDPRHAGTRLAAAAIRSIVEREISPHRIAAPDADLWCEAGIVAGVLSRLRGYRPERQQACLNDAIIYLQAAGSGQVVLTRNVADFDLLGQIARRGRVLFYRRREPVAGTSPVAG